MFIILIINSRPRLTGATCFPLLGQLHSYVTPAFPSKEHSWNWFRPYAHWQCTNKSTCLVHSALKGKASPGLGCKVHCHGEKWEHRFGERGASIFSFYMCKEMRKGLIKKKKDGRDELRKNSLSVLKTFQVVDCHPKTLSLQQAARNGTSLRNVLSLYRKQHITASGLENSTLHEVTAFWGQHSHSLGVKLTPQLDQENVCERVCVHTGVRASMCVRVCVYTQLCFFNDTYSHILSPKKTGWPRQVLISWRCPAPGSAAVT